MLYSFQGKALTYWKAYVSVNYDRALHYRFCKRKKNNLKLRFFFKHLDRKINYQNLDYIPWLQKQSEEPDTADAERCASRNLPQPYFFGKTCALLPKVDPKTQQFMQLLKLLPLEFGFMLSDPSTLQIQTLSTW